MIACMSFLIKTVDNAGSGRLTKRNRPGVIAVLVLSLVMLGILTPLRLRAEQHVVSLDEIQADLQTAQARREKDVREVQRFFSAETVGKGLAAAGLDAAQVQRMVPDLDDGELARLAERTRGIERDLAAGALNNQQLTYIAIALATAVVVILAT